MIDENLITIAITMVSLQRLLQSSEMFGQSCILLAKPCATQLEPAADKNPQKSSLQGLGQPCSVVKLKLESPVARRLSTKANAACGRVLRLGFRAQNTSALPRVVVMSMKLSRGIP